MEASRRRAAAAALSVLLAVPLGAAASPDEPEPVRVAQGPRAGAAPAGERKIVPKEEPKATPKRDAQPAPAEKPGLTRKPGLRAAPARERRIGPPPPEAGLLSERQGLKLLPSVITRAEFEAPSGSYLHPGTPILGPDGTVVIHGRNFGSRGVVRLKVDGMFRDLQSTSTNTTVTAKLPPELHGSKPRPFEPIVVFLVVSRTDQEGSQFREWQSDPYSTMWRADHERRMLNRNDKEVRLIVCSDEGDDNDCTDDGATFEAFHRNTDWAVPDVDGGRDRWAFDLEDGWRVEKATLYRDSGGIAGVVGNLDPPIRSGDTSWVGEVPWSVPLASSIRYKVQVSIVRARR